VFQGRTADRASDYLGKFPGPLKLLPSRLKWSGVFLLMLLPIILGLVSFFLFFLDGTIILLPIGLLLFFYCGFLALRAAIAFASGAMWLALDEHGFADFY
jgi:hypothetical protein